MRCLSSLIMAAALLFAACNSNKKPADVAIVSDNGKEKVSVDMNKVEKASAEMQKMSEDVQKLPPLSLDQLKAMIAEGLMSGKKSSYNATSAMGAGVVNAEYKI